MLSSRISRAKRSLTTGGKIAIIVAVVVIIAVGAYGAAIQFGSHPYSTTYGTTVKIAMTVSQEGQYASLDAGYLYLNNAWESYVNSHGGLVDKDGQHHNVTVNTQDDQSDPTKAVQLYHQFAEQQGANILVSPYSANTGLELLPVSQSDKVPLIMS
jgi:ABC-type branched-subunit amino acid transport system substrate-binding protein